MEKQRRKLVFVFVFFFEFVLKGFVLDLAFRVTQLLGFDVVVGKFAFCKAGFFAVGREG